MPKKTEESDGEVNAAAFMAAAAQAAIETLPGKSALHANAAGVECTAAWAWSRSVDLDAAFGAVEPNAAVWDAGIGLHRRDRAFEEIVVWIEPHPASSTGTVGQMLNKLDWLKAKLSAVQFTGFRALTEGSQRRGSAFRWLARTGRIRIRPGSREHRQLIKAGLGMPSRHLTVP